MQFSQSLLIAPAGQLQGRFQTQCLPPPLAAALFELHCGNTFPLMENFKNLDCAHRSLDRGF
jgi:hypothetical protein